MIVPSGFKERKCPSQYATSGSAPRSEVRFAGTVKVGTVVNEKMAGICFPNVEGAVDFKGLIGYNMTFQRRSHDLFEEIWSSASKAWPA